MPDAEGRALPPFSFVVHRAISLGVGAGFALCLLACDSRRPVDLSGPAPATLGLARPPKAKAHSLDDAGTAKAKPVSIRRGRVQLRKKLDGPEESNLVNADSPDGTAALGFIVDSLVDVAAAGPATATPRGVAMVNRKNHLLLARLSAGSKRAQPQVTPVSSLPASSGPFPLAKGPAVRNDWAYWVSRGRLLRERLSRAGSSGAPAVLATDARVGTRVSVPIGDFGRLKRYPDLAAYIARPQGEKGGLQARLWQQGKEGSVLLTEEASSATSVSLMDTPRGLSVLSLEGRTGMSTVHMRNLRFSKNARGAELLLEEDRVVWVGGASGPMSEFWPFRVRNNRLDGLMTTERDMTHFGLVELGIPLDSTQEPVTAFWMDYLNGLQPAPVAGIEVCGRTMVLVAQPDSRRAHASQRLVWIRHRAKSSAEGLVLARARSFFDLSVAKVPQGVLLVYVADHRTWARTVRCSR